MKRRVLAIMSAVVLLMSSSINVAAANNEPVDTETKELVVTSLPDSGSEITVWGKIIPLKLAAGEEDVVVSVNLSWGNLKYDYDQGVWSPTSLAYENGEWLPTESGVSDKLTLTNRSNVNIGATLSFANYGGYYENLATTDVFYGESEYTNLITDNKLSLESAVGKTQENLDTKNAFLKISGTPLSMYDLDNYVKIGTVTVTITQEEN